jgi:hypothetical protein
MGRVLSIASVASCKGGERKKEKRKCPPGAEWAVSALLRSSLLPTAAGACGEHVSAAPPHAQRQWVGGVAAATRGLASCQ